MSWAEPRVIIPTDAIQERRPKMRYNQFRPIHANAWLSTRRQRISGWPLQFGKLDQPRDSGQRDLQPRTRENRRRCKEFQNQSPRHCHARNQRLDHMYNYPKNQPEDQLRASLCGYGTFAELAALFLQHNITVPPPSGMPSGLCYAMFIWNSIGIIDHQSMLNMTNEAWVRTPVTIIKNLGT